MKKFYQFLIPLRQIKQAFTCGFNVFEPIMLFKEINKKVQKHNNETKNKAVKISKQATIYRRQMMSRKGRDFA